MSDKLRRCRSVHPDDPTMQCQGEVTELTMHIEDHWHAEKDHVVRWPVIRMPEWNPALAAVPAANPDRVKVQGPARDQQVGGDHYRKHAIQVWDIVDEYGLSYYAGLALKYLLRAGEKGPRVEDLKKARHVLDRMIEKEE